MAQYVSEITQFLTQLKTERPQLEAEQKRGRAIWWDKQAITPDEAAQLRASRVAQRAYVYGSAPVRAPAADANAAADTPA